MEMDNTNTIDQNNHPEQREVVGVRFRDGGKTYFFSPNGLELEVGMGIIVETVRGYEFATVTSPTTSMDYIKFPTPLRNVIRIATDEDIRQVSKNRENEVEAMAICADKIREHKLDMQLISCEYNFEGTRITFSFVSENRVDFRALVRDLAAIFRTRIELRQIGVRDKAKMLGGIGSCGRTICCTSFLHTFAPVTIKMAKDQNIALSPTKISGVCGRLMCCLKYEQDVYEEAREKMPAVNREVVTPDGAGIVVENNMLTEKVKVKMQLDDGSFDVREYHLSELRIQGKTAHCSGCCKKKEQNCSSCTEKTCRTADDTDNQGDQA